MPKKVPVLTFNTSQEAWEGINEYFINEEELIIQRGGKRSSGLLIAYDTLVVIEKAWVDPMFNFGKSFNYHKQKWSRLISNYVDLNNLELVKSEISVRERKKSSQYNIAYQFINEHSSGKGCLLSCTFTRRLGIDHPILIVNIRSSEIVKRLIFDLLLLQRMGEFIYGTKAFLSMQIFFPNMYSNSETSAMYNIHKPFSKFLVKDDDLIFQKRVLEDWDKYSEMDPEKIKYGVHRRASRVIQGTGTAPALLAKDCNI